VDRLVAVIILLVLENAHRKHCFPAWSRQRNIEKGTTDVPLSLSETGDLIDVTTVVINGIHA